MKIQVNTDNKVFTTTANRALQANAGDDYANKDLSNLSSIGNAKFTAKQDALTAGANITINGSNVISATDTKYSAGTGIVINDNIISNLISDLSSLSNVEITSPTQGQNLTYDATLGKWKNTSSSATVAWGGISGTLTDQTDLQNVLDDKLTKNTAITGETKCKITYDTKGLVTGGSDLSANDIPSLTLDKISDITATATELNYIDGVTSNVQTQLDGKVSKSGDTMTGNLTIAKGSNVTVNLKRTDLDYTDTTIPTSQVSIGGFSIRDKNGKEFGYVDSVIKTNGNYDTRIVAKRKIGDAEKTASIHVEINATGAGSCTFPNTTCVDGQWVVKNSTLASGRTVPTSTNDEFSLSSYLPNDGAKYEVLLDAQVDSTTTINTYASLYVYSINGGSVASAKCVVSGQQTIGSGNAILYTGGSTDKIYVGANANYKGQYTLCLRGYRRIGTNS